MELCFSVGSEELYHSGALLFWLVVVHAHNGQSFAVSVALLEHLEHRTSPSAYMVPSPFGVVNVLFRIRLSKLRYILVYLTWHAGRGCKKEWAVPLLVDHGNEDSCGRLKRWFLHSRRAPMSVVLDTKELLSSA